MSRVLWMGLMVSLSGLLGALALQQTDVLELQVAQGGFLTDGKGRSVYLFSSDSKSTSTCYEQCAQNWPPLLVKDKAKAAAGVDEKLLSTAARRDGALQVTYAGMPLYYFARDQKAGDTAGQGVGGVWFLVTAKGEAVKVAANQDDSAKLKAEGEAIFGRACASCHGAQGQGGVGAPLVNNANLKNTKYVVEALVKGVGYMPAVGAQLSNRELAAVITYIRTSFNNSHGAVSEDEVARSK